MEWGNLKQLKKELNGNAAMREAIGGPAPIGGISRRDITKQIAWVFNWLHENHPGKKFGLSPLAVEFREDLARADELFARVPYSFIRNELAQLTGNEIKVLLAFKLFGSLRESNFGETFVGLETVAETAGVNLSHIDRAVKSLRTKGFLVNLRKHHSGTWVRKVSLLEDGQ